MIQYPRKEGESMGKTSSEVKRRYNDKTYRRFTVSVKKDLAEQFVKKLKEDGIENYSVIFHEAIDRYLNDKLL